MNGLFSIFLRGEGNIMQSLEHGVVGVHFSTEINKRWHLSKVLDLIGEREF